MKRRSIKFLSEEEKPREKLKRYGPSLLEDYELLAIILGKGSRREDVLSMSYRIMENYWIAPSIFLEGDVDRVRSMFNISFVQACQLIATFELGRRMFSNREPVVLKTPEQVFKYAGNMSRNNKEVLRGLYLNTRHKLIWDEIISIGTVNQSIAHPREIMAPVFEHRAHAFILVHNHPSGDPTPSEEDTEITRRVLKIARIMEVDFLDHIIIGENRFFSFRKETNLWS